MKMSLLAAVSGVVVTLGGCMPAYQSVSGGPARQSRAETFAVLYGTSPAITPTPLHRDVSSARQPTAETAEIYSNEWKQLEAERESRLKQSSAICRC